MSTTFNFEELDSATREYLTAVRDSEGRGTPGVFAATSDALPGCGCVLGPIVILATLGLTLFRSLAEGIVVGVTLGVLLFIRRMSQTTAIEAHVPLVPEDVPDDLGDLPMCHGVAVRLQRVGDVQCRETLFGSQPFCDGLFDKGDDLSVHDGVSY